MGYGFFAALMWLFMIVFVLNAAIFIGTALGPFTGIIMRVFTGTVAVISVLMALFCLSGGYHYYIMAIG